MALKWRYSTGNVPDYSWNTVTFGNGIYMAVADGGATAAKIMTSTDGDSWTIRSGTSTNSWGKVCYGNYNNTTPTFIAISGDGTNRCMRSTNNGVSWSNSTTTPNNTISWTSVCFGNNRFIAVGNTGTVSNISYSDDGGNNWSALSGFTTSLPIYKNWADIAFGNGRFIAISSNNVMTCTSDPRFASNWTLSATLPSPAYSWTRIRYIQNNTFIATGINYPRNMITYDGGVTWSVGLVPTNGAPNFYTNTWNESEYGNNYYVTVGSGGAIGSTVNTISWNGNTSSNWIIESTPGGVNSQWKSVVFANNKFVAVGTVTDTSGKKVMIGEFYTSQTTLTNFPNLTGNIGTSQTLNAPTSNQTNPQGAISYSSNDTRVATISGSTITFGSTAGATAMITARQEPTSTFSGANIYAIVTLTNPNAQPQSSNSNNRFIHFIPSLSFI